MALLQISEPGGAPDPHQRRIAIGIDLGTTHSLVAALRHGVAECLSRNKFRVTRLKSKKSTAHPAFPTDGRTARRVPNYASR